jgi:hypothetical protein
MIPRRDFRGKMSLMSFLQLYIIYYIAELLRTTLTSLTAGSSFIITHSRTRTRTSLSLAPCSCPSTRTFLYKAHAFGTELRGLPVELLFLTAVLLLLLHDPAAVSSRAWRRCRGPFSFSLLFAACLLASLACIGLLRSCVFCFANGSDTMWDSRGVGSALVTAADYQMAWDCGPRVEWLMWGFYFRAATKLLLLLLQYLRHHIKKRVTMPCWLQQGLAIDLSGFDRERARV